ncbi:MAG: T9SS type A sorting domain-containing protein, partial [Bacteroidales bacterium]|nr:T9SS type A sorting domain-containing protein [Bacteroidales bacterium]
DQKNVRMYDTTFNLTWTVKMGKGRFINPANNQVVFIADSTGNVIVNCQAENGVSYDLKLFVREPVSVSPPITNDFVLYPNPASEYLFLTNSVNSFNKVEIFNAEGKLQFVTYKLMRNDANTISINISQLPVGIYYCRIVQSNHVIVRKFVVSR